MIRASMRAFENVTYGGGGGVNTTRNYPSEVEKGFSRALETNMKTSYQKSLS